MQTKRIDTGIYQVTNTGASQYRVIKAGRLWDIYRHEHGRWVCVDSGFYRKLSAVEFARELNHSSLLDGVSSDDYENQQLNERGSTE